MKKLTACIMILGALLSNVYADEIKETNVKGEIGRYQVSTTYRSTGNWVMVTIIDTVTGEIVKQERYNGFSSYSEK